MLFGMSRCATKRTSGLSMPMPKAMVATITMPSSRMKRLWCSPRVSCVHARVVGQRVDARVRQERGGLVHDLRVKQ